MAGQTVDLYAWPSDAVLRALKPGQLVPTTLLATATTSSAGRYMLRVPVAKLKTAAVESGFANMEIFSAVGGFWFFPYQTGSLPGRPSAPVTVPRSPDLGVKCGTDDLNRPLTFTGFRKIKQLNPAWAIIGQGYIAKSKKTNHDNMQFNYNQTTTQSQTSTLGLGVSGYGIDAGYNHSGTDVSTATAGQGFRAQTVSTWFRTLFNVAKFRGMCVGRNGDTTIHHDKQHGYCPRTYKPMPGFVDYVRKCFWMARSTGWFGPSGNLQHRLNKHPLPVPATPAKFCGPEPVGGIAMTHNQRAVQWSSGFDIGASGKIYKDVKLKVSFSSSAQTGYDADAQMVFNFGHEGYTAVPTMTPKTRRNWSCGAIRHSAVSRVS